MIRTILRMMKIAIYTNQKVDVNRIQASPPSTLPYFSHPSKGVVQNIFAKTIPLALQIELRSCLKESMMYCLLSSSGISIVTPLSRDTTLVNQNPTPSCCTTTRVLKCHDHCHKLCIGHKRSKKKIFNYLY